MLFCPGTCSSRRSVRVCQRARLPVARNPVPATRPPAGSAGTPATAALPPASPAPASPPSPAGGSVPASLAALQCPEGDVLHTATISGVLACLMRHFRASLASLPLLAQPLSALPIGTWAPSSSLAAAIQAEDQQQQQQQQQQQADGGAAPRRPRHRRVAELACVRPDTPLTQVRLAPHARACLPSFPGGGGGSLAACLGGHGPRLGAPRRAHIAGAGVHAQPPGTALLCRPSRQPLPWVWGLFPNRGALTPAPARFSAPSHTTTFASPSHRRWPLPCPGTGPAVGGGCLLPACGGRRRGAARRVRPRRHHATGQGQRRPLGLAVQRVDPGGVLKGSRRAGGGQAGGQTSALPLQCNTCT